MLEKHFNTEIINSIKPFWFAHKLTDSITSEASRFTPNKPCDTLACIHGRMVGIESKLIKKWQGFSLRFVREGQRDALDEILMAHGRAFLFVNIRIPHNSILKTKRENRLLIIDWQTWDKKLIKIQQLKNSKHIKGAKGTFDLSEFFRAIKNNERFSNV